MISCWCLDTPSCLTPCNPRDGSPPGSSVHWVLWARILEWVAMPSSRGSSQPRDWICILHVTCTGSWLLYHWCHLGCPVCTTVPSHRLAHLQLQLQRKRVIFLQIGNVKSDGKESACNVGDPGLILGLGRSPGEGNGNPSQYSCLENSTDREAWWLTVRRVTKSWIWLRD